MIENTVKAVVDAEKEAENIIADAKKKAQEILKASAEKVKQTEKDAAEKAKQLAADSAVKDEKEGEAALSDAGEDLKLRVEELKKDAAAREEAAIESVIKVIL